MNVKDANSTSERHTLSETMDGRSIHVNVENSRVVSAKYDGTIGSQEAAILTATCDAMVGYSLREATEHSAFYALRELILAGVLPTGAKSGILLPNNFHPDLARAQKIIRKIYRGSPLSSSEDDEWNYEDRGLSAAWIGMAKSEKRARIATLLSEYSALHNIAPDFIVRFDIDKFERIGVEISKLVEINGKPKLLMHFEQYLRAQTKERLEVFAFEMKDLNRIRRL